MRTAAQWVHAYLADLPRIGAPKQRIQDMRPRRLKAAFLDFERHRETTVTRNTQGVDRTMQLHALEFFGDCRVDDVPSRLQPFFDELARKGYLASTVNCYAKPLFAFLRWAKVEWDHVTLPAVPEQEARYWTDDELVRIRESADYVGPEARLAIEAALGTGARQQELFALEWVRLHEATRTLRIVEQLDRDTTARIPLKGKRARTALVLPAFWAYVDAAVPGWRRHIGLILPGAGGRALYARPQLLLLNRVLDAARIKEKGMGWHTARHTYARLLLESGGSIEQLRVFLGHKVITTTDRRYGHFSEQAAVRMARMRIFGTA